MPLIFEFTETNATKETLAMVRYDKCVEALYDSTPTADRSKTLQMIKVMKGAISMSKSRTGECIFRTNKTVKKDFERIIKIENKNSNYNLARIDTSKKIIVDRWKRSIEQQTSCSSETLFVELMGIKETSTLKKVEHGEKNRHNLKGLIELRLSAFDSKFNSGGFKGLRLPRKLETADVEQTETKQDDKEKDFVAVHTDLRSKYTMNNPQLAKKVACTQLKSVTDEKGEKAIDTRPTLQRDLTDWKQWQLNDKAWIKSYITREKTKQEDLIIRNALNKIEHEMSGPNMIKRHQVLQKLQNDRNKMEAEQKSKPSALDSTQYEDTTISIQNADKQLHSEMAISSKDSLSVQKIEVKSQRRVEFKEPFIESVGHDMPCICLYKGKSLPAPQQMKPLVSIRASVKEASFISKCSLSKIDEIYL